MNVSYMLKNISGALKRITIVVLAVSMIVTLTACGNKEHKYVISEERCFAMFGCFAEEWEKRANESYWIAGNYVSADTDEEGKLLLVLDDKHARYWKTHILEDFDEMFDEIDREEKEYSFKLNEDYTGLICMISKSSYDSAILKLAYFLPYCGIMQMLNGADPNEWYLDISMTDIQTGAVIKTGRMPDDGSFGVNDEDWDKALEEKQSSK